MLKTANGLPNFTSLAFSRERFDPISRFRYYVVTGVTAASW